MKTQLVVFILSLFSVGLFASVQEDDRVVFASRDYAPHTWKVHPTHLYNSNGPHQNELITFRVLLKKNNLDLLEKTFWEVNNPTSPKYGQFLTKAEIDTLIAPSTESKERVASWLKKYSLTKFREEADFFEVTCPVLIAEKMFRTKIIPFTQQTRVLNRIMGDASIPRALVDDIELVSGISELFSDQTKYSPNRPAHTGSESTVTNVMEKLYAARNPEAQPQAASTNVGEDLLVTPSLIRSYYSIPANQKSSYSGNSQGIAAFDDYFSSGALDAFAQDQGYPTPSVTRVGPVCFPHKCDQFESDLDIQYVTAIGMNTATQFINHDQGLWILGWTQELSAMTNPALVQSVSYGWSELQQCDIATTKCQSLGYNSQQYVSATNIEFQKLGARGLSIFVSDGDDGAASLGAASGNCPLDPSVYCIAGGCRHSSTSCGEITINAGGVKCFWPMGIGSAGCAAVLNDTGVNALNVFFNKNQACRVNIEKDARGNLYFYSGCSCSSLTPTTAYGYTVSGYSFDPNNGPLFTADYPTSSPYVTSVGATQFVSSGGQIQKEIVASVRTGAIITTGGGFSSFQPQPSYQKAAVAGFLNSGASLPPSFSYNISNRAYPDITLVGHNYKVFVSTNEQNPAQCPCTSTGVDGTSASSPAVAGFFTLINDQLLSNGGTPLGFLNPLLYQIYASSSYSQIFNDIVEGDNKCTRSYCCKYGWAASRGWDPVSGIGSPKWSALSSYIMNLKLNKPANKINLN